MESDVVSVPQDVGLGLGVGDLTGDLELLVLFDVHPLAGNVVHHLDRSRRN